MPKVGGVLIIQICRRTVLLNDTCFQFSDPTKQSKFIYKYMYLYALKHSMFGVKFAEDNMYLYALKHGMFGVKFAEDKNNLYVISKHFKHRSIFFFILHIITYYLVYISR